MNILIFEDLVKVSIVLIVLFTIIAVSRRNVIALINTYAIQSLILSSLAFLFFLNESNRLILYTALITLLSKAIVIPILLKRTQKKMKEYSDIQYDYMGPTSLIFTSLGIIIVIFFSLSSVKNYLNLDSIAYIGIILSLSISLIGMLITITRKKVITKLIGYLMMENGVVMLSIFVTELPFLIEVLILMDLLVLLIMVSLLGFGMNSSIEEFHEQLNPFRKWFRKEDQK